MLQLKKALLPAAVLGATAPDWLEWVGRNHLPLAHANHRGATHNLLGWVLVTALGFGLSAFVTLAAVQTSLDGNIAARVPQRAPDYFVLDVPKDRLTQFRQPWCRRRPRRLRQRLPAQLLQRLCPAPPAVAPKA